MLVMKKNTSEDKDNEEEIEFWPRLLKDKSLEKNQVKIDWDRYVDEDEEDESNAQFDQSALQGGGGMDPNNMDMASLMKQMLNLIKVHYKVVVVWILIIWIWQV